MPPGQNIDGMRGAVGVFDDPQTLQEAMDKVLRSGFYRAELSLLASEETVEKRLGHQYEKAAELENDVSVPRKVHVSSEFLGDAEGGLICGLFYVGATAAAGAVLASGGTLAVDLDSAAVAGGAVGLIGPVLAIWLDDRQAQYLREQLDYGGLLLWVRHGTSIAKSAQANFSAAIQAVTSIFISCPRARSPQKEAMSGDNCTAHSALSENQSFAGREPPAGLNGAGIRSLFS